jgi:hypothetical protein
MGIQRKFEAPAGITDAAGRPEIVLEIDGLVLSMAPPSTSLEPIEPAEDGATDGR